MTPEAAGQVLERLFRDVRDGVPLPRHPEFRYSCSAGLAFVRYGEALKDVLRRADQALYAAKSDGRDRWMPMR